RLLAEALSNDGYAASAGEAPAPGGGDRPASRSRRVGARHPRGASGGRVRSGRRPRVRPAPDAPPPVRGAARQGGGPPDAS
ncbi:hypothetical protein ACFFN5_10980, partial [Streptomonospora salina]